MASWKRDGKEIFFVAPDGTLMSAGIKTAPRLEIGSPKPLFKLPSPSRGVSDVYALGVARDGKRFLVAEEDQQEAQIVVVSNWTAELKQ